MTEPRRGVSERLDFVDGLRGVAILAVLVFHLFTWPRGGFLGVDFFFVISGFLITNRLLRDAGSFGTAQLRDFYYGRVLRIVPAMAEVVLLYGVIKLCYPAQVTLFRENVLSAVFLFANWARAFRLPYPDYLGHIWSLSIEEQYYLIWPLVIFCAIAAGGEKLLARVASVLVVGFSGLRLVMGLNPTFNTDRLYNGTDTRIASILVGCLVAVLLRQPLFRAALEKRRQAVATAFWLSILGMIAAMLHFGLQDRDAYSWGLTAFSMAAGFVLVYPLAFRQSGPARALAWRPLVWVGQRSYGLYLFHFPIFLWLLFIEKIPTGWTMAALCVPPTFVLAALSWRFVEEPCMRLRYRRG